MMSHLVCHNPMILTTEGLGTRTFLKYVKVKKTCKHKSGPFRTMWMDSMGPHFTGGGESSVLNLPVSDFRQRIKSGTIPLLVVSIPLFRNFKRVGSGSVR